MSDLLERGDHRSLGPVLIAAFLPHQAGAKAIVYSGDGRIHQVPITELSVLWHYDAGKADWESDFPINPTAEKPEP